MLNELSIILEKVVFKVFFTVDTDHFFSIGFEIEQQFKFNVKIVNIIYVRKCAYIVVLIAYVSDVNILKRFFTRSVSFYVP